MDWRGLFGFSLAMAVAAIWAMSWMAGELHKIKTAENEVVAQYASTAPAGDGR